MGKIGDNPYPGPRAFRQADHALFRGRDEDCDAVVDQWMLNRLTIVTGPVASGKTSLLLAGVYPLMPVKRTSILPVGDLYHGMTFPIAALPDPNPLTFALLRSWSPDDVPTRLAGLSISDFVRRLLQTTDGPAYAAIDQLDDFILDLPPGAAAVWRQQFLADLAQALDDHPRLHLLLMLRTESIDRVTTAVGGGARHAITAQTVPNAAEAVARPALAAGRFFTDGAVSRLLDNLRATRPAGHEEGLALASTVEPSLLQLVCRQLWEDLPASVHQISEQVIGEFSDADMTLAAHCAQVIGQVTEERQLLPRRLRGWLLDNLVTDNGTRGGAYEGMPATAGMPNAVPRALVDRHLLTREADGSARCYRLLNDRLIEPLRLADVEHPAHVNVTGYLAAAERDVALGELDYASHNADQALGIASDFRERAHAKSLLGNVAHRRGRNAQALPRYRAAANLLQAAGDTSAAAVQLAAVGRVLLSVGRTGAAVAELRAAVDRTPNDLALQTQLAHALWQLGEGRTAVGILNWVLTMDGAYMEARRLRGEILADLGDAQSAMADLDRVHPRQPSTQAARGLALAELGDHATATKEINDAVVGAEHNGPVLLYAARALDLTGDRISASERAREAIDAADPPLSPPHRRLALKLAEHSVT
jgi:tetratricopeptide (TPR) repeat protein